LRLPPLHSALFRRTFEKGKRNCEALIEAKNNYRYLDKAARAGKQPTSSTAATKEKELTPQGNQPARAECLLCAGLDKSSGAIAHDWTFFLANKKGTNRKVK
jgi:hypothetical protein